MVQNIHQVFRKPLSGSLFILNGLIICCQKSCINFCDKIVPCICEAMKTNSESDCARLACGLVSDIALHIEKNIGRHLSSLVEGLLNVLTNANHE